MFEQMLIYIHQSVVDPFTKASGWDLIGILFCQLEKILEQTVELLLIRDVHVVLWSKFELSVLNMLDVLLLNNS